MKHAFASWSMICLLLALCGRVSRADTALQAWGPAAAALQPPVSLTNAVALAVGRSHALALKPDGRVVAWGDNTSGQAQVPATLAGVAALAAGQGHSLALKRDGTVVAWGDNSSGQARVPGGLGRVLAVAAGDAHSLALKQDGSVTAWGDSSLGQTHVPWNLANVVALAAGGRHSLALRADGIVVAWGANDRGQCNVPSWLGNVRGIAAGPFHSLALRADGAVIAWGDNSYGQAQVPADLGPARAIAAGWTHSLALRTNGTLVAWGADTSALSNLPPVLAVAAGFEVNLALTGARAPVVMLPPRDQTVYAGKPALFGAGLAGTLPLFYQWRYRGASLPGATNPFYLVPATVTNQGQYYAVIVSNAYGVVTSTAALLSGEHRRPFFHQHPVSCVSFPGGSASFLAKADGTWPLSQQWRFNGGLAPVGYGPLLALNPLTTNQAGRYTLAAFNVRGGATSAVAHLTLVPVAAWGEEASGQTRNFAAQSNVVALAAGAEHSVGLGRGGRVLVWGRGPATNLPAGLGNFTIQAVASGWNHVLALKRSGTVVAWGDTNAGQTRLPAGLAGVAALAAGGNNSLALKYDGTVVAWGESPRVAAVPAGLDNVQAIAVGRDHALALRGDGSVAAWGGNECGQTSLPYGLTQVVAVAAGDDHSLALRADGTVVAWGAGMTNAGTGAHRGQSLVPYWLNNVTAIAGGAAHSLALRRDGTVVAWGNNDSGQAAPPPALRWIRALAAGGAHSLALVESGPPFLTRPALPRVAPSGSPVTLRIEASGVGPFTYQWRRNGVNLPGATNATLLLPAAQATNSGRYSVVVLSPLGRSTSSNYVVNVVDRAPAAHLPPLSRTNDLGDTALFQAEFTGSLPMAFQWLHNDAEIPGATNAVLTLTNLLASQEGWYRLRASNPAGQALTPAARLTLLEAGPVVVTPPASRTAPFGSDVSFTVVADGAEPFSYQWTWNGVALAGATNDVLTLSGVTFTNLGAYAVVVTNPLGRVVSTAAQLDLEPVVAWGAPGQESIPAGLSNIVALAAGPRHGLALWTNGHVTAWGPLELIALPLGLTNVAALAAGTSHSLALRADGTVVAWGQGDATNVPMGLHQVTALAAGDAHSLALTQDGTVISWGDNTFGQAGVPGGLTGVTALAAGSQHSLALLSNRTVVAWGDNTQGQLLAPDDLTNAVAVAAGARHSLALRSDGTVVAWGDAAAGQTLVPTNLAGVAAIAAGAYHSVALTSNRLVVAWGESAAGQTNVPDGLLSVAAVACGASNTLVLAGSPLRPWATVAASTGRLYSGGAVTWRALTPGNARVKFQWLRHGVALPGATNDVLILTDVRLTNSGSYSVAVTGLTGIGVSAAQTLTVLESRPLLLNQPASTSASPGGSAAFTIFAEGSTPLRYQWSFKGVKLAGATNRSLVLSNITAAMAGAYAVTVTNALGKTTSSNALLTVLKTVAPASAGDGSVASGEMFRAAASGIRLESFRRSADGVIELRWNGESAGVIEIQVSDNLVDWETVAVRTNTGGGGALTAPAGLSSPRRFYRAVRRP